jgi:hypothetical protein
MELWAAGSEVVLGGEYSCGNTRVDLAASAPPLDCRVPNLRLAFSGVADDAKPPFLLVLEGWFRDTVFRQELTIPASKFRRQ